MAKLRTNLLEKPLTGLVLSVVVPTYMERESIVELIERIESSLQHLNFEIIIVDDASPDGTAECAESLGEKYRNIKVVRRTGKLGLASAVLDGFKNASGDVLAVMDADLQHPPELLPQMYMKICEGYDLVVASRYIHGGGIEEWSLRRRFLSKGATFLAHLLLPRSGKVKDVMSGFFMLKRDVIKNVSLNPVGYKILLEIIVKGEYDSVFELPYVFQPRRKGRSSLSLKETWNYIIHLRRLIRRPKPT